MPYWKKVGGAKTGTGGGGVTSLPISASYRRKTGWAASVVSTYEITGSRASAAAGAARARRQMASASLTLRPYTRFPMLGDDLGELLGHRIPADHSRPVLADHYAGRLRARRVMDLGCGAGDSVDLFRAVDPGVRWVGVDIEESAEVAERTRADAEFVTFDGRTLPFGDESFDLIYCKQVLEHVEHPRELVAEAMRVLEPGGHLAGSTSQLEAFHSRSIFNWTPYALM